MLVVRNEQMIAMQASVDKQFAFSISSLLYEAYAEYFHGSEAEKLDLIVTLIARARSCDMQMDETILAFIELWIVMGENFMQSQGRTLLYAWRGAKEGHRIIALIGHAESALTRDFASEHI